MFLIGASLSKPHTCQTVSPAIYLSMIYRTSLSKCPHVLIHWTASILQYVIPFCKYYHVQIIAILHMQWAYSMTTSMCTLVLTTHNTTQLGHSLLVVH